MRPNSAKIDLMLSLLLRWGAITSAGLLSFGWLLHLIASTGNDSIALQIQRQVTQLRHGERVLMTHQESLPAFVGDSALLINAGIIVLILLPVLRVGFLLVMFVLAKDWTYVALTTLVLFILFASAASGLAV